MIEKKVDKYNDGPECSLTETGMTTTNKSDWDFLKPDDKQAKAW
jgi:hypothetical protein